MISLVSGHAFGDSDLTLSGACLARVRRRWSRFGGKIWHNALQLVPAVLWTWAEEVREVNKPSDRAEKKHKKTIRCQSLILWYDDQFGRGEENIKETNKRAVTWGQNGGPVNRLYQQEVTNKSKLTENNECLQHDNKGKGNPHIHGQKYMQGCTVV